MTPGKPPHDGSGRGATRAPSIPPSVKLVYTALFLVWAVVYWRGYGPSNFLWFCDLANFVILAGLWTESPLLLSSQAVSVVLVQTVWSLDVLCRLLTGSHPIGATEYLFDASTALGLRLGSLFHPVMPPFVLWCLWRLGYDRRGWLLQTAIAWVVLPVCYALLPDENLNLVRGPGDAPQTLAPPLVYLAALLIGYPLALYLPTHLLLRRWFATAPRREDGRDRDSA